MTKRPECPRCGQYVDSVDPDGRVNGMASERDAAVMTDQLRYVRQQLEAMDTSGAKNVLHELDHWPGPKARDPERQD